MPIRITCVKRIPGQGESPYAAIVQLNWVQDGSNTKGSSTRLQLYAFIQNGGEAYVEDADGNKARLICAVTEKGMMYVRSDQPDAKDDDVLLQLPDMV